MPAARGIIRRPLIGLSRADVIAYLKARGIPWRIDASNDDNRYFRNRIRNCLVPLLEELFPGWGKGLDALGETQALTADFIAGEARLRVPWEPPAEARNSGSFGLRTGAENFFAQPAIIREEALFQGINTLHEGALQEEGALQGAEARSIRRQSLRRFCRAAGDRMPDLDLNFCRIRRDDAFVVITGTLAAFRGRKGATETGFSLLIKEPGIYKLDLCPRIETSTLTVCPLSAGLGGFIAALPLVLRPAYNDDFIVRVDRRLSLKDLRGSLPKSRRAVPVTAALDSQGVAAFIAVSAGGTTVWDRGDPARVPKTGDFFFFSIGGIDAQ
jgi:tRNA(Ile)-lysidine synthase